jgi:hypothetical protein
MSIELARSFLLWCAVINYAILLLWFVVFTLAHDWMRHFHGRWFRCPMSSSTVFTILGCRYTRSGFFSSTSCRLLFYGSSAKEMQLRTQSESPNIARSHMML